MPVQTDRPQPRMEYVDKKFIIEPPRCQYEANVTPGTAKPCEPGMMQIAVNAAGNRPDRPLKEVFYVPTDFIQSAVPGGINLDRVILDTTTAQLYPEKILVALYRTGSLVAAHVEVNITIGITFAEGRGIVVKAIDPDDRERRRFTAHIQGIPGHFLFEWPDVRGSLQHIPPPRMINAHAFASTRLPTVVDV